MSRTKLALIIVVALITYFFVIGLFLNLLKNFRTPTDGAIAIIEVEGVLTDARSVVRQLKKYARVPDIKGIVLRIESPGGGVVAAQEIYNELKRTKERGKKIVVSMGSVAASGGYYIATPADLIIANPGTITGSIGVIMNFPIVEELLKKIGIKFETIKSDKYKDIGSPFRPLTEKERALLYGVTQNIYEQFLNAIIENRKIPYDSLIKIADGRILSGAQAKQYGLVDSLGSYEDAIKITANLCGIKKEPKIIKEPKRFSILNKFGLSLLNLLVPKPLYLLQN
ncbi:MAG: signal peptide peptidase SppA [candidate division WOR-3 bacterium]|nr:signal peptide peptidase SppA [candidate division WOR-3 bacterium]MCX7757262.1 signal peptide peptidase SppA [candidate division WOR-3 bacterium]MDW7987706.1 signal peptide peptidase SppA [candidate division WOR-3 bacterium]